MFKLPGKLNELDNSFHSLHILKLKPEPGLFYKMMTDGMYSSWQEHVTAAPRGNYSMRALAVIANRVKTGKPVRTVKPKKKSGQISRSSQVQSHGISLIRLPFNSSW